MMRRGYHNTPRPPAAASPAQWRKLAWQAGMAALGQGVPAESLREALRGATVDSFPDQAVAGRYVAAALSGAVKAYLDTALEERRALLKPLMKAASDAAEALLGAPASAARADLDG
jgi:hypothetical protein